MRRRQLVGIAIAAALGLAGAAAAAAPNGSRGGLIAFHRSSGTGVADIYVVRPDGSGLRRLTATRDNFAPAWSPDGRRIAFASDRAGGSGAPELYVMDADGGDVRRVTRSARTAHLRQASHDVAWSPDGTRLVFVRLTAGRETVVQDLFVVDVDGSGLRRLTRTARAAERSPAWSPDGTLIAFERGGGVWTTNVDGTGARKIVASGSRPSFSPDGRKLLFADPNGWVAEIGADGRWRRNIVKGGVDPSWSPDGRRLVYQGRDGLYVIDADRTDRRRLTRPPRLRHDLAPAWQPTFGPKGKVPWAAHLREWACGCYNPAVRYRRLGSSDLVVSEIALGSWLTYSGGVSRERAVACIDRAFELGITLIDTANVYGRGAAEELLGDVLAGRPRDSYVLATKLYHPMSATDRGLSREQVHMQIEASLRRLRVEYVDLYQCHRYDDETPLEETMEALTEVVRAGKARYIGFSEWKPAQIRAALELPGVEKFVSSQPQYSLLHRAPEREVFPLCAANGISQIVWSPLAQGVLTGKYRPGEPLPEGTRATSASMGGFVQRWLRDDVLEAVQRLRPIADGLEITLAQLALAWVLREPNVAAAIVGASRPEQVDDNAAASGVELDDETLRAIDDALAGVPA